MIQLDENFTIEPEPNCWTLNYRAEGSVNEKTGKPTITTRQTFHISLKQTLEAYFDEKLKTAEIIPDNILKIGEAIKTVYSQIKNL